jgi:hypothetical protein
MEDEAVILTDFSSETAKKVEHLALRVIAIAAWVPFVREPLLNRAFAIKICEDIDLRDWP